MDPVIALLVGLVIGLAVGAVVGLAVSRARSGVDAPGSAGEAARLAAAEATVMALREQLDRTERLAEEQVAQTTAQYAERAQTQDALHRERLDAQESHLREQIGQQEDRIAELQTRLREIQRAEVARTEEDGRVLTALSPVAESLKQVQAKVHELEEQRRQQHGELSEQLRSATEAEERLRATAETLASALRSNSTRGVWGETQLRSVVEAAGLIHRVDFDVQTSVSTAQGIGRPDMVVHLPGGKNIAVDAKAPFTAYLEASAIPASATGPEGARRDALMKQHVQAVRDHITALGSRAYWEGLDASPEMVIAFIPSESLVSSALEADPSIMEFAFSRRVALSSPVTLWSVLKTVAFSWQQEVLTEDAKQLFDLSRELHARLATSGEHIAKLGRSLTGAVGDYNRVVGSLERQVLPTARRLSRLDESKVIGTLEPLEATTRELTADEFTRPAAPVADTPAR
ncbi:DNA recombination protein RmuC [Clavibacter lycopersici]|uniref:DNA recombination protein RmuC n=1 Tax=Clavibacter lycopersici TaxID=2301718 RepID=A0A399TF51_9MICO|nr:DNA recombination protein RmuC [Clavibacter lycopersici]RIJ52861.1 DNA recombination protein RmuC [Clavibacter lycopersici]RIJ62259.1 DNA recombination protein RmuC [Clavibacter lycopersici]